MANGINNTVIMGRICNDPELRTTQSNKSVTSFCVAVDRRFQSQGEEKKTDFIDCVAWNNNADFISKWFKKGSMIAITGEIQTRNYEDKNGNKRKAVEVVVNQASFCGSKNDNNNTEGGTFTVLPDDNEAGAFYADDDEGLPF